MEANIVRNLCYNVIPSAVEESQKAIVLFIFFLVFTTLDTKAQIIAEADCPDAYTICDASQSYYFEVNGPGVIDDAYGALVLNCQSQTSATQFESSSAWIAFTPKYTGEFGFYILPDINEDWEFMLFGNNPDCTDLHNMNYHLICNSFPPESETNSYTGIGVHPIIGGGPGTVQGFEDYIIVNAGEQYILFITPFVWDGNLVRRTTLTFQGELIETYGADAFEQVAACTLGVGEYGVDTIQVYPNPVTNALHVKAKNTLSTIEVYNLLGQKLLSVEPNALTENIDMSGFDSGLYLVRVAIGNQIQTYKVLKE